jgi:hypothetical protein
MACSTAADRTLWEIEAEQMALIYCPVSNLKPSMRTPSFTERLSASNAAKKAQLERARWIVDDPERAERVKAREEIAAARNNRIAEREAARRTAGRSVPTTRGQSPRAAARLVSGTSSRAWTNTSRA